MSNRLIELCNAKALDDQLLFLCVADHAPVILDLDLVARLFFCFLWHDFNIELRARRGLSGRIFHALISETTALN